MVHLYLPGNPAPLIAMIIFACYFFIVEIVIFVQGKIFLIFTDIGNIVDLFLVISLLVYSSLALQYPVNFYNNRLLPVINITSWIRFTQYMRNFTATRVFVQVFS